MHECCSKDSFHLHKNRCMNVVQKIPFICTFNQSIAILEKSNAVSSMAYVFVVQNRYSIVYPCVKQVESLEPNCVRIIIEGYTSFGIQGVNLREAIEKRIKHPDNGPFGSSRNGEKSKGRKS
jgi:hypothetical protein